MNAIWDHLYLAFGDKPLPENAEAQEKLKQGLARLEAHPAKKGK